MSDALNKNELYKTPEEVLKVLFGQEGGITAAMNAYTAASLLVFSLLYTPCVAAIASIRRELGRKWSWYVIFWQCALAWIAALAVHLAGMILGGA